MSAPDQSDLRRLLDWTPPSGVVSVYFETDPADRRASWRTALRDGLKRLAEEARESGDRDRRHGVEAAASAILERVGPDAAREGGRVQVGFVAADGDCREEWFEAQVPLRAPEIVHDERPYLKPLVELLEEGRERVVAAVSADRVRLLHWSLGRIAEIASWEAEIATGEWRERKGPSMRDPARGHATTSAGRDQHEQRRDANRERFLREAGRRAAESLAEGKRTQVVCFADAALADAFASGLGPEVDLARIEGVDVISEPLADIGERVKHALPDLNRERQATLVRRALDAANAGGSGCVGVQETLQVLAEGRVDQLILDPGRSFEGQAPPELLEATTDGRPLAEWMIEQAIRTSATVVPLAADVAGELDPHEGVAAILRY